jgi:predicted porin
MKKSLLALAVLGAFAGAASAQSSVTMYGRVDLSIGKPLGTKAKGMFNGSGSRLGMRGVEELGGGLKGIFNIETRFDADTGRAAGFGVNGSTAGVNNRFWGARSIVGVEGGFGRVTLGREYTTAFLGSQLIADPWGWDTVVAGWTAALTSGAIGTVRNDSALTYTAAFGGVSFGVQTAERTDTFTNVAKRPLNLSAGFGAGPFRLHLGHERPGNNAKWTSVGGTFKVGPWTPGLFFGTGNAASLNKHRAVMFTSTFGIGAGELRFAFGNLKDRTAGVNVVDKGLAVGYHHSLSKRTTVYADFARNNGLAAEKSAFDVGLKHNF